MKGKLLYIFEPVPNIIGQDHQDRRFFQKIELDSQVKPMHS